MGNIFYDNFDYFDSKAIFWFQFTDFRFESNFYIL